MDLSFGPKYEKFKEEVKAFLSINWPPNSGVNSDSIREFRVKATEAGYLYRSIPRKYGGSEQEPDLLRSEVIRDCFTAAGAPMELRQRGVGLLTPTLLAWGTEAQKARFIPPTLRGKIRWAQGYSEPGAGSDLAAVRTRADLVGDEWVINGQKVWSSEAHESDYMFMLVRTEPEAPKHAGISYLLVDLRRPGITIRPLRQITGDAEFNEVFFDNVRTPADLIVGPRGRGWEVSRTTLKHERSNLDGIIYAESMFNRLVRLAKDAVRNGQPAIKDPDIRRRLAALQGWVLATRYSTYREFSMTAAGDAGGVFPLMMKLNGSNLAREMYLIGRDLIGDDFLLADPGKGGFGDASHRIWARHNMTSIRLTIAGGTSNIQRNIIAERALGLPRDNFVN